VLWGLALPKSEAQNKMKESPIDTLSREWEELVKPLFPIPGNLADLVDGVEDAQLRQEFFRSLYSAVALGYFAMTYSDAKHPDFWPYFNSAFNWFGTNPDTNYFVTLVDDGGSYLISGYRGSVKQINLQFGNGSFVPRGIIDENYIGRTLANYDFDDLSRDEKGHFEVLVSRERPEQYTGDWWPLPESSTYALLRQISYDWVNEIDGRYCIERLDTSASKPRIPAAELKQNLANIPQWTEGLLRATAGSFLEAIKQAPDNEFVYKDVSDAGGLQNQRYAYCQFRLKPDEALLIEIVLPSAVRYWSLHLTDHLFFSLDWVNRLTSVNGFAAHVGDDNIVRIVVCESDPGVSNWLDSAGYSTGFIQGRWEFCSEQPEHRTRVVEMASLHSHLPVDSPRVSPKDRDSQIRERRRGAQMRKRW
jgi:hypothetical protein